MNFFRGRIRTKRVFKVFFLTCLLLVNSTLLTYAWFPFTINHSKLYTTVQGKVTDRTTQKGISGAVVEISYKGKVKLSKTTDVNGNYYSKEKALLGKYVITAKKDSYKSASKTKYLVYGGKYTINFSLTPIKINFPPQTGIVTPDSGMFIADKPVTFKTNYTDDNGYKDIKYAEFLINTTDSGKSGIYLRYDQSANKLYGRNETDTIWMGGYTSGSSNVIENSYVKLICQNTKVIGSGSSNDLTIEWQITFKPAFYGAKNIYLYAADTSNANSGWNKKGSIVIDNTPPQGTVKINDGDLYTNSSWVKLTISITGSTDNLFIQMRFSNDNETWSEPEEYKPEKQWQLTEGEGEKSVYVQFSYVVSGVWSDSVKDMIILDTKLPDAGFLLPLEGSVVTGEGKP